MAIPPTQKKRPAYREGIHTVHHRSNSPLYCVGRPARQPPPKRCQIESSSRASHVQYSTVQKSQGCYFWTTKFFFACLRCVAFRSPHYSTVYRTIPRIELFRDWYRMNHHLKSFETTSFWLVGSGKAKQCGASACHQRTGPKRWCAPLGINNITNYGQTSELASQPAIDRLRVRYPSFGSCDAMWLLLFSTSSSPSTYGTPLS